MGLKLVAGVAYVVGLTFHHSEAEVIHEASIECAAENSTATPEISRISLCRKGWSRGWSRKVDCGQDESTWLGVWTAPGAASEKGGRPTLTLTVGYGTARGS